MELLQQTRDCSDFDVIPTGETSPSYRVLLPEHIMADESRYKVLHMVPGRWQWQGGRYCGEFDVADSFGVSVALTPRKQDVLVVLGIHNRLDHAIKNVRVEICTALNHLPGEPNWCNRAFMPADVPLDRSQQGRAWFEQISPSRLFALTAGGWIAIHPCPDLPDAEAMPLYSFTTSERPDAMACAVGSLDGESWFFQAWSSNCDWQTPCPGNCCMHLCPVVAAEIASGGRAEVHGIVGIHSGDRDSLAERLRKFRSHGD